jgi:hypothetical protein
LLTPSLATTSTGRVISKVQGNHDFWLPFRQHAPSLANGRREIYSKVERFASNDGVAFFNVLAFRGVFFGSPFARSAHYRWFESLNDWTMLRTQLTAEANEYGADDEYYVNPGCYGRSQKERKLKLLDTYWERRLEWNDKINQPIKPSIGDVFNWLKGRTNGVNLFPNIGALSAMLICGDLVEAGILAMPSVKEWATLIHRLKKGAMAGMEMYGLTQTKCTVADFHASFALLDEVLQRELLTDEKEMMGYNIIMLEHTLCKIKRLTLRLSKEVFLSAI